MGNILNKMSVLEDELQALEMKMSIDERDCERYAEIVSELCTLNDELVELQQMYI